MTKMADGLLDRSAQGWVVPCVVCLALCQSQVGTAKDLLPPKEQEATEIG